MPTSSSICYHCIICFESFDCDKIYPVVFPCGHTYVCNECANRIDKCYECRENLFYYANEESNTNSTKLNDSDRYHRSYAYNSNRRRVHDNTNLPHPPNNKKVKKRLPLPKNLVLCSLIETNLNASNVEKQSIRLLHDNNSSNVNDMEFDLELRAIVDTNTCGTYIVTDKDGVNVYFTKPKPLSRSSSTKSLSDNSTNSSSRNLYESIFQTSPSSSNKKLWSHVKVKKSKNNIVTKLNYGDKIQIVSIEEDTNYAILARRYGYVASAHIKRISGPIDKVCRLEGILYNLFIQWKNLQSSKSILSKLKKDLIKEFKIVSSDSTVQDLTIIPASDSMRELLVERNDNVIDNVDNVLNTTTETATMTSVSSFNDQQQLQERRIDNNNASKQRQQINTRNNSFLRTGRSGHSGLTLRPSSSTLSNGSIRRNNSGASYASGTISSTMSAEVIKPSASKELVRRNNGWNNIGCNFSMCYS